MSVVCQGKRDVHGYVAKLIVGFGEQFIKLVSPHHDLGCPLTPDVIHLMAGQVNCFTDSAGIECDIRTGPDGLFFCLDVETALS